MNRQEASLEMLKHELSSDMRKNSQKASEIRQQEILRSLERRLINECQYQTSMPCAPRRLFSPLQQMPNLSFKMPSHASTTAIETKLSSIL